jgi:hypothetical protein
MYTLNKPLQHTVSPYDIVFTAFLTHHVIILTNQMPTQWKNNFFFSFHLHEEIK